MIPVAPQPEPPDFAAKVRNPGSAFLRLNLRPTREDFRKNSFWGLCLPDLRAAYRGVCAYSAVWLPMYCSVDHFLPKSVHPNLAYEWMNYRLALEKINGYKGDSLDVLDPFHIQTGWFALDFATFFVHSEAGVRNSIRRQVQRTIDLLRLNEESLVELRYVAVRAYSKGDVTLDYLEQTYPFIACELKRQGVQASILGTVP